MTGVNGNDGVRFRKISYLYLTWLQGNVVTVQPKLKMLIQFRGITGGLLIRRITSNDFRAHFRYGLPFRHATCDSQLLLT